MYIRRLKAKNLKRLADFDLSFTHRDEARMWTVLIGENGTAKTTILQAIALAAAGSKQVNTLVGGAVKHLRDRRSDEELSIEADFDFTADALRDKVALHPHLESRVQLRSGFTSLDAHAAYTDVAATESDPLDDARALNTQRWFVGGYGIARVLPDANYTPPLARPSIERLEPLFKATKLVSTGFANHFLEKDQAEGKPPGETSRRFGRMIQRALRLGGRELFPDIERLELRVQESVAIAGVALSHGYQSAFAWIADLIGHVLFESKTELETTEMEGLVLIDEIDLYLHPSWQASFIPALRRVFPRMQFVATTHSPVVLSSLAPHEIVRLVVDPNTGNIVQGGWAEHGQFKPGINDLEHQPDPRLMTGGELYRTWFGLEGLTPNPLGERLRQLNVLATHPEPTPFQRKERDRLSSELRKELRARYGKELGDQALAELEADFGRTE